MLFFYCFYKWIDRNFLKKKHQHFFSSLQEQFKVQVEWLFYYISIGLILTSDILCQHLYILCIIHSHWSDWKIYLLLLPRYHKNCVIPEFLKHHCSELVLHISKERIFLYYMKHHEFRVSVCCVKDKDKHFWKKIPRFVRKQSLPLKTAALCAETSPKKFALKQKLP